MTPAMPPAIAAIGTFVEGDWGKGAPAKLAEGVDPRVEVDDTAMYGVEAGGSAMDGVEAGGTAIDWVKTDGTGTDGVVIRNVAFFM